MKTFTYRLYPTKSQERQMEAIIEECRELWNVCLEQRKICWQRGISIGKYEQQHQAIEVRPKHVHSQTYRDVTDKLDLAFNAYFRRLKNGEKPGYPRFRGKGRMHSFGFQVYGNGCRINGKRLYVFGVGRVAVRWNRSLEGKPKVCHIIRKADGWYVGIVCDTDSVPLPENRSEIGIDVGLSSLLTLSNGIKVENPRFYRKSQRKLQIKQRALSRKVKGGSNRNKARKILARQHLHTKRQRQDVTNKLVHDLISEYGYIALEDLEIQNMIKNKRLSKSIMDAGWGYFRTKLSDKAEEAGRVVTFVDPAYTSQTCSLCGKRFPEKIALSKRWVECECGTSMDRDENAARNILAAGRAVWALMEQAAATVAQEAA